MWCMWMGLFAQRLLCSWTLQPSGFHAGGKSGTAGHHEAEGCSSCWVKRAVLCTERLKCEIYLPVCKPSGSEVGVGSWSIDFELLRSAGGRRQTTAAEACWKLVFYLPCSFWGPVQISSGWCPSWSSSSFRFWSSSFPLSWNCFPTCCRPPLRLSQRRSFLLFSPLFYSYSLCSLPADRRRKCSAKYLTVLSNILILAKKLRKKFSICFMSYANILLVLRTFS